MNTKKKKIIDNGNVFYTQEKGDVGHTGTYKISHEKGLAGKVKNKKRVKNKYEEISIFILQMKCEN